MTAYAHAYAYAYAYDARIWRGLQDGAPLPTDRWIIEAPIAVGGTGAEALTAILPNVTVLTLADHARTFLLG